MNDDGDDAETPGTANDSVTIESFIYAEEAFFDPITGEPATGSVLPAPVPITIVVRRAPVTITLPPPPVERTLPDRPIGEFVTSDDLAQAMADMIELVGQMIRDALAGLDVSVSTEGLVTQDTFQAVVRDFALVRAARVELVDAMFATQSERFQGLEGLIATTLSEIENRRLAEIAEVEEATGFSPMAIFSGLGDFMRDPVNYVLDKSRDQILEEISLGLNR